jgi:SAM-dependent methyltransferase
MNRSNDRSGADAAFPEEIDPTFYRGAYPDLRAMTEAQARAHFASHGIAEGRQGAALAAREGLIGEVRRQPSVLEIGPFCNPVVRGRNVAYFDVLDRAALRARAVAIGQDPAGVPAIDFVAPDGDLSGIGRRFAAVISAHCIEHQPDLVRHLTQVAALLGPGGHYFLIVPDRRYCFDHFLPDSSLSGVLAAHREGRRVHRLESVIEHRALTTHNWVDRHWAGDHLDPAYHATIRRARAGRDRRVRSGAGHLCRRARLAVHTRELPCPDRPTPPGRLEPARPPAGLRDPARPQRVHRDP